MLCPLCNVDLALSEKQGIEIDYYPKCRGIWLDRGELEKIIERSAGAGEQYQSQTHKNYDDDYRNRKDDYKYKEEYKHKKKSSFLGDLFDF